MALEASTIALIGLGLGAAGATASIIGQEQAKRAQENTIADERFRQKGLQKQATSVFADSLSKSGIDTAQQEIDAGAARRENAYANASARGPAVALPVNKVAADSGPTGRATAISKSSQNAWAKAVGGSEAKLGGGQDWLQEQQIKDARANQDLSVIGNKAAGSERVAQTELVNAGHRGDSYGQIGQILSTAGMLVGMGSAVGGLGNVATSPMYGSEDIALSAASSPGLAYTEPTTAAWSVP